jgi:hypothetical protein
MSLNWLRKVAKAIDRALIKPLSGKLRKQNTRDTARARLRTLRDGEDLEEDEAGK